MYQKEEDFKLKISKKCCSKLKKEPLAKYEKIAERFIAITGMTKEEGGQRRNLSCIITDTKTGKIKRFHPLSVITEENVGFIDWYIAERKIQLCELYYPPFNFKRTGCKGCPYSLDLQDQLYTMACYLPEERKQCEIIWGKVYDEYRRIGYRLENTLF
jgi:3'-phosphoadenosine 5'-phosphosulfate sulfotransferase (PAPS reductase)/FAD synthetase